MKITEGLLYYHCQVETTAGNRLAWSGWASSQEDAEGKAQNHFYNAGVNVHSVVTLGHE